MIYVKYPNGEEFKVEKWLTTLFFTSLINKLTTKVINLK